MNNVSQPKITANLSLGQAKTWLSHILRLTDLTVMLHGAPGVGKSAIVEQIAREQGYELIVCSLLLFDPTEMKGIPYVEAVTEMPGGVKRTIWAVPERWPRPAVRYIGPEKAKTVIYGDAHGVQKKRRFQRKREHESWDEVDDPRLYALLRHQSEDFEFRRGILFLDEFNVAPSLVQCVTLKLVDSGRIETYELPKEWRIVVAGNLGAEDGAYISRTSSAVNNRFVHFFVEPNPKEWVDWARKNGIHGSVIAFIQAFPDLLSQVPKRGEAAFPTPRMWVNLSQLLTAWEEECQRAAPLSSVENAAGNALVRTVRECGAAFVGLPAAVQFAAFVEVYEDLDAEAVIVRGDFSKLQIDPGKPDRILATLGSCIGFLKATEQLGETSRAHYRHFAALLKTLPQEYQIAALQLLGDELVDKVSDADEVFYQEILAKVTAAFESRPAYLM